MAILGRKKKAVARAWEAVSKQREAAARKERMQGPKSPSVNEAEHEARLKMLKNLGLIGRAE